MSEAQAEIIREIASHPIEVGVTWPAGQGTCPSCRALMLEGEAVEVADQAAGRHPQGLTVGVEPHRPIEQQLMPPEFTGCTHTEEQQELGR